MIFRILTLACLLAALSFGAIITNGTFDSGVTGWTFANSDANTWWNPGGNPGGYAVINNSPSVVPTMSQTLSLTVGNTYQLTWDMISPYHCCSSASTPGAGAAIDGNLWEFIVPNSQTAWQSYSQTFTYTGGSSVLTFSSQRNGTDTDAGIDNVVVTDVTPLNGEVPEPATCALIAAGLGALALLRRRS